MDEILDENMDKAERLCVGNLELRTVVQTWGRGASDLVRRGRRLLLVGEVCHRVKIRQGIG